MKFEMNDLLELRRSGIYCLENEEMKHVQIFASRNILEHVSNLMKKIDTGEYGELKNDVNRINFKILEITDDVNSLKVLLSGWINKYRNDNYKLYRDTNLVCYKVKDDYAEIEGKLYYIVYLENKRKDKMVVGVFNSRNECMSWKSLAYPNNCIDTLVLCENEYTYLIK